MDSPDTPDMEPAPSPTWGPAIACRVRSRVRTRLDQDEFVAHVVRRLRGRADRHASGHRTVRDLQRKPRPHSSASRQHGPPCAETMCLSAHPLGGRGWNVGPAGAAGAEDGVGDADDLGAPEVGAAPIEPGVGRADDDVGVTGLSAGGGLARPWPRSMSWRVAAIEWPPLGGWRSAAGSGISTGARSPGPRGTRLPACCRRDTGPLPLAGWRSGG
jgi:hypothetical protein